MADNERISIPLELRGYSAPINPHDVDDWNQVPPIASTAQFPLATSAQEDSKNDSEMWNMYLDEVKEEDGRITNAWNNDANNIVTFTSLLSAIIGIFIIEFYKKLSPDSGDQTVALLQQISHQLPNSPTTSAYSNSANQPSPPGTAMVWVNALWLISLVLSLTCALMATLLQQWGHRYAETPKSTTMLRHRVRVRSLLLVGTRKYNIPLIVEILPTLLHLSVYLFLSGLVIAFHTIHKTVAIVVNVAVGVSVLAYILLSILPCVDVKCPYRTPISKILWYPYHALLSLTSFCLHWCLMGLQILLNRPVLSRRKYVVYYNWLWSRRSSASSHWRFLKDGLEESIVHRAVETLRDGDSERITRMFNQLAMGDKDKLLKFAASIPRYIIPNLIPNIGFDPFRESLLVLLRSCVARRYAALPNVDVHERSLLVCLHAIRHIVKANAPSIPDLNFMRDHFANAGLMRPLWGDMHDSIRILSRSICTLVAKQVISKQQLESTPLDATMTPLESTPLDGADISWLEEVTGESSNSILEANATVRDQMNFKSFVKEALRNHVPRRDLSAEDNTTFNETLAILLGIGTHGPNFATRDWQTRLSEEVGRIQRYDPRGALEVFNKLCLVFSSLSPVTSAHPIVPPRAASPHAASLRAASARATSPALAVYPPGVIQPSHGAHRRRATM